MKTGDYINEILQDTISSLALKEMKEKAKRWLTLYIFLKKDECWISLCEESDESESISEWVNQRAGENWSEILIEYGAGACYSVVQENVADHRIGSGGKEKTLLWLIRIGERDESLSVLAAVILKTLVPKYEDMLFLEDMLSLYEDQLNQQVIKKKFFFGDIFDREKLTNRYINQVKENYILPEFLLLCHLASARYERRQNHTTLYLSDRKQRAGIKFDNPNLLFGDGENLRTIRKIMEISGDEGAVYIQQPEMLITGVTPLKSFDGLTISFTGNAEWILSNNRQKVLIYREGEYLIPAFESTWEQELEKLEQLKGRLPDKDLNRIKQIIRSVKESNSHGTAIVFMDGEALQDEIKRRFAKKGYAIKARPFSLMVNNKNRAMLRGVTAIDGAILSDLKGYCQAIGTILDGEFVVPGNPGRGSRYNSIRNYVQWYKNRNPKTICFAVIISEDGMIDVEIPIISGTRRE